MEGFLTGITVVIFGLLMFFYRYPVWTKRYLAKTAQDNIVYSPAYGRIMSVRQLVNGDYFIAIFLSPLDIHYQFAPMAGQIIDVVYDATGIFELAYELNKSHRNEKAIYTLRNQCGDFKLYQIAGRMVRRISRFIGPGAHVQPGDTVGLIHFGSRVDIIIPNSGGRFRLLIGENDQVSMTSPLGVYI